MEGRKAFLEGEEQQLREPIEGERINHEVPRRPHARVGLALGNPIREHGGGLEPHLEPTMERKLHCIDMLIDLLLSPGIGTCGW